MPRIQAALATLLVVIALVSPTSALAHDVPNEVSVQAYVKPQGNTLTLLVRAPMSALQDVDVPLLDNGFLDLTQLDDRLRNAAQIWIRDFIQVYENGDSLPLGRYVDARVSIPADRSFNSYDTAYAHTVGSDLEPGTQLYWQQGLLDIAYDYPIQSEDSQFSIVPGLTHLGLQVNVQLHYVTPSGTDRVFDVHADVGRVELDPTLPQAAVFFAKEGFIHFLTGIDYLLLILALVLPFRRPGGLAAVVVPFMLGSSATIIAAGNGLIPATLWFPYLVQSLIALAILWFAIENIIGARPARRAGLAFGFGLVFGFALAFVLQSRLQFAGAHSFTSIIAYDIGVQLAVLLAVLVAWPLLALIFRFVAPQRIGIIIISAFVANTAWDEFLSRNGELSRFPMPSMSAIAQTGILWWVATAFAAGAVIWMIGNARRPEPDAGGTAGRSGATSASSGSA